MKKVLSLILTLALCLGLCTPAWAADTTTKTLIDESAGLKVTLNEFIKAETRRYYVNGRSRDLTFYVVADNSKVTYEALEGRKYAETEEDIETFWAYEGPIEESGFAFYDGSTHARWSKEDGFEVFGGSFVPLYGPRVVTVKVRDSAFEMSSDYYIVCESQYAQFVPFEKRPIADSWAKETLARAYDAGLFDSLSDPFENDTTREMTRIEFAAVSVSLYAALQGKEIGELELNETHPFKDVETPTTGSVPFGSSYYNLPYVNVGYAYHFGFITGTSGTTFGPYGTLTREQAATILARVYSKLYGDIPAVTVTGFADDASISSWAKSSVAFMAQKGMVNGVEDNLFAPQQTLSVQEAVVMAQRMLENLR